MADTTNNTVKEMVIFFIIDASKSMEGGKIGAVNIAIRELIPEINELSNENEKIKIAILEFSTGAAWLTKNGPVEIENFQWKIIEAEGTRDFGAACWALNAKLSTKAFMNKVEASYAPVIILFTDGSPTDSYQNELDKLKQNNWFKTAIKVGIAIGDDADKDVLTAFTGTKEAVLEVHITSSLMKFIRFIDIRKD